MNSKVSNDFNYYILPYGYCKLIFSYDYWVEELYLLNHARKNFSEIFVWRATTSLVLISKSQVDTL